MKNNSSIGTAFCGMGNEPGWERWTQHAHDSFQRTGISATHIPFCSKDNFRSHIKTPDVNFYYHLCHGGSYGFSSGMGEYITGNEISDWMSDRPHMRFAFIGSCGAMEDTGTGTLCCGFSKYTFEQCAIVGYVRMGEPGSGWPYSLSWQTILFQLAFEQGLPIYEALLRAQSEFPQMSANWGFWGDRFLTLKSSSTKNLTKPKGRIMEWKRAKSKSALLTSNDLQSLAKSLLRSRSPDIADELFEARQEFVTEEDTGNLRLNIRFDRKVNGIPIVGDYVSMDLDPQDGEVLFVKQQTQQDLPALSANVPVSLSQAASTAKAQADKFLADQQITLRSDSLNIGKPELVFTSAMLPVHTDRFLAYRITLTFKRLSGRQSHAFILIDANSGKVVALTAPPP